MSTYTYKGIHMYNIYIYKYKYICIYIYILGKVDVEKGSMAYGE